MELGIELALVQRDRAGRQAQIHVFTDLPANQLSLSETQQQVLTYHRVGETDDNMALASVHVYQNPFQDYSQAQAYILVRNYANRTKTATLRVELNGQAVFQEAFSLSANNTRSFSLGGFTGPGQLAVHLESEDALAVDNHALNWVAERRSWQLVLVSPAAHLHRELQQLSQALPGVTLRSTRPEDFSPAQVSEQDVVLFHQFVPDEAVPANSLYVFPPVENSLFPVLTEAADLTILDWDDEHEILHNLQYVEALPFKQARILALPSWAQVLISSKTSYGEIPLALTGERDGRRIVCLAFDLGAGNLTDSDNLTLLVLFLNALRWLRPPNPLDPHLLPAGDVFFLPTDIPLDGARLSTPQTEVQLLEADTVPLDRVGIYRVEADTYRAEMYANLFDEAESNIGRQIANEIPPSVSSGVRTSPEAVQRRNSGRIWPESVLAGRTAALWRVALRLVALPVGGCVMTAEIFGQAYTILTPKFLWLLLLLPLLWLPLRRRSQRRVLLGAMLLRTIAALLIILALAGLSHQTILSDQRLAIVAAVDTSDSIVTEARTWMQNLSGSTQRGALGTR